MAAVELMPLRVLISTGHAIIAELYAISCDVPHIFKSEDDAMPNTSSSSATTPQLIHDLRYYNEASVIEARIRASPATMAADVAFRHEHGNILRRTYKVLRRMFRFWRDMHGLRVAGGRHDCARVADDDDDHHQEQQQRELDAAVEVYVSSSEGVQLLAEVLYLWGAMLLVADVLLKGTTRERLFVSYMRYAGAGARDSVRISELCQRTTRPSFFGVEAMMAAAEEEVATTTTTTTSSSSLEAYPVAYFKRLPLLLHKHIPRLMANIMTEDVRTSMMDRRAAIIFVLSFFDASVLMSDELFMQRCVDRLFSSQRIIAIYAGITVDVDKAWATFPAATHALQRSRCASSPSTSVWLLMADHERNVVRDWQRMQPEVAALAEHLSQIHDADVVDDDDDDDDGDVHRNDDESELHIADELRSWLTLLRDANAWLRFVLLHTAWSSTTKKNDDDDVGEVLPTEHVLRFLLDVAHVEGLLRRRLANIIRTSPQRWRSTCAEVVEHLRRAGRSSREIRNNNNTHDDGDDVALWFDGLADMVKRLPTPTSSSFTLAETLSQLRQLQEALRTMQQQQQEHGMAHTLQPTVELVCALFVRLEKIAAGDAMRAMLELIANCEFGYGFDLISAEPVRARIRDVLHRDVSLSIKIYFLTHKLASLPQLPCQRWMMMQPTHNLVEDHDCQQQQQQQHDEDVRGRRVWMWGQEDALKHYAHAISCAAHELVEMCAKGLVACLRRLEDVVEVPQQEQQQQQRVDDDVVAQLLGEVAHLCDGLVRRDGRLPLGIKNISMELSYHDFMATHISHHLHARIEEVMHACTCTWPTRCLDDVGGVATTLVSHLRGLRVALRKIHRSVEMIADAARILSSRMYWDALREVMAMALRQDEAPLAKIVEELRMLIHTSSSSSSTSIKAYTILNEALHLAGDIFGLDGLHVLDQCVGMRVCQVLTKVLHQTTRSVNISNVVVDEAPQLREMMMAQTPPQTRLDWCAWMLDQVALTSASAAPVAMMMEELGELNELRKRLALARQRVCRQHNMQQMADLITVNANALRQQQRPGTPSADGVKKCVGEDVVVVGEDVLRALRRVGCVDPSSAMYVPSVVNELAEEMEIINVLCFIVVAHSQPHPDDEDDDDDDERSSSMFVEGLALVLRHVASEARIASRMCVQISHLHHHLVASRIKWANKLAIMQTLLTARITGV